MTAALLAAVALTAAACGSSSSSSSTTTSPPSTTQPSTTTSTSGATTTTSAVPTTSTTSTAVRAAACASSQLSISAGQSEAGLGHIGVPLLFRNTGPAACSLYGYPGVAGLDAEGNQVVQATRTPSGYLGGLTPGATTPAAVDVAPGQVASALVEGTDVPVGTAPCPQYPALLVTPPGATESVRVRATLPGCSPIEVHPVVPGSSGNDWGA